MTSEKNKSNEIVVKHKNQTKSEIEFSLPSKFKVINEKSDEKSVGNSGKNYNKKSETLRKLSQTFLMDQQMIKWEELQKYKKIMAVIVFLWVILLLIMIWLAFVWSQCQTLCDVTQEANKTQILS